MRYVPLYHALVFTSAHTCRLKKGWSGERGARGAADGRAVANSTPHQQSPKGHTRTGRTIRSSTAQLGALASCVALIGNMKC